MKLLTTVLSTLIIFTGLYLCLFLGNELLISIDQAQQSIKNHTTYIMEVAQ